MEPETTCTINNTPEKGNLYMAMELSQKEWKLGFSVGPGDEFRRGDREPGGAIDDGLDRVYLMLWDRFGHPN